MQRRLIPSMIRSIMGKSTPGLYRVVGIRPDGHRVITGNGLTAEEAMQIRDALVEANVFPAIHDEVDLEPVNRATAP